MYRSHHTQINPLSPQSAHSSASATRSSESDTCGSILIVDDDASIRFAMADYFSAKGYLAESVDSCDAAKARLALKHYAVVLTDLRLDPLEGGAEGLEVVRLITEEYSRTACIVLTAYGSPESETIALNCGASAFLHKPQRMADLLDRVKKLLSNHATCRSESFPVAQPQGWNIQ